MSRIVKYRTKLTDDKRIIMEKESSVNCPNIKGYIKNPEDVSALAKEYLHLHEKTEEYLYMICVNTKGKIIGLFEISHGCNNKSIVGVREIFQKALLINASNIILIHNHPSGDCTPSLEDIKVTNRLVEAGKIIGIDVLDHVIIGDKHYSLMENNCLGKEIK